MNQEELNSIKIYTISDIVKVEDLKPDAILSAEQVEAKLAQLEDRIPLEVISELERNLKKVRVTEKQCSEIIERVISAYESSIAGDDLEKIRQQLNGLENYVAYFQQYLENEFQKTGETRSRNINAAVKGIETDIISVSILLKWVEFLLSKTGEENLAEVLQLYIELGWIDKEISDKMLLLARGLEVPQSIETKNQSSRLTARDHIQSLIFIERLRAIELVEADFSKSGESSDKKFVADQIRV